MALGFYLNRTMSQDKPETRLKSKRKLHILLRHIDDLAITLRSFLDSGLYLGLTVQIATIIYYYVETLVAGFSLMSITELPGGHFYNLLLMSHMSFITLCPILTLMSTPYFRRKIRRRGFRLLLVTAIMAGAQ